MSDSKSPPDSNEPVMSREDIAYFIRTMWGSLLIPKWNRGDLIDMGTEIHAKTPLSKMDTDKLNKLLPNLSTVAENFGKLVGVKFSAEFKAYLKAQRTAHAARLAALTGSAPSETPPTQDNTSESAMSREDIAYYIRTMWAALIVPNWEKNDLIDLGMAIFTKTTLAKMDQKKMGKLLPSLSIVAEHFGKQVGSKFATEYDTFLKSEEAAQIAELEAASATLTQTATVASETPATPEQPVVPPAEQPIEQHVEQPVEQPVEQAIEQPVEQTTEQLVEQSIAQSTDQPAEQTTVAENQPTVPTVE